MCNVKGATTLRTGPRDSDGIAILYRVAFMKIANVGKCNSDQYEEYPAKTSNLHLVFGSASPNDTIDLSALMATPLFWPVPGYTVKATEYAGRTWALDTDNPWHSKYWLCAEPQMFARAHDLHLGPNQKYLRAGRPRVPALDASGLLSKKQEGGQLEQVGAPATLPRKPSKARLFGRLATRPARSPPGSWPWACSTIAYTTTASSGSGCSFSGRKCHRGILDAATSP